MNSGDNIDPLSQTLRDWKVQPRSDPNFRPAVWQRIREQSRVTWTAYVRSHLAAWATVAIVAVSAAGWAGRSVGRAQATAEREAMVMTYLVELDPRVQAKLQHQP